MDRAFIYALIDPRSDKVRYIGKANDVMGRYRSHVRDARRRDTPVYRWWRHLNSLGLAPVMATLAMCHTCEWKNLEENLIAEHRKEGKLLNVANGGDEPFCPSDVRAMNGRNTALRIHSNKTQRRVWEIKRTLGGFLADSSVKESAKKRVRAKLRLAARINPSMCGGWATI